jgi:hypothetical protein
MSTTSRPLRGAAPALLLALVATVLTVLPATPVGAEERSLVRPPRHLRAFTVEAISTRPDMVTGGDVLLAVRVPVTVPVHKTRILRNGHDVTDRFRPDPDDRRRLVGLVDGLEIGGNTIEARAGMRGRRLASADLVVVNHPLSGPVFSGPHQTPFVCRTEGADLGPPLDDDCTAPTRVDHVYRSTDGTFKDLPDPTSRPHDLARTTTRAGQTVDYVVRIESGTINRAVYRTAVLAAGGEAGAGWAGGLVYAFGGGCGTGYHQGTLGRGSVLDHRALSRGFAVASSSLNVYATACNDVVSAETAMMVKERLAESLGRSPRWTMGWGGSGGSIQQLLVAHNYPGILDGLVPSATFQDSQLGDPVDCRLLNRYFAAEPSLSAAQRTAITGYHTAASCTLWDAAYADVIAADRGCDASVPRTLVYDASTNPGGARCTVWDSMVNVYGRDPTTGFARQTLDNVGVEYGREALASGAISFERFLDLNERIGGYDVDGRPVAARSVADLEAVGAAHRTGRLARGGALSDVAILDLRTYTDKTGDLHTSIHSHVVRQRLRSSFGHADNHVMWRAAGGGNAPMVGASIDLMADWLDALVADRSRRPRAEKVVEARPETAVDACWTPDGERIDERAGFDERGRCAELYPPAATTRMAAGAPLAHDDLKCALRPADPSEYGTLTAAQTARLRRVFPDGVCDYGSASIGAEPYGGTWQRIDG